MKKIERKKISNGFNERLKYTLCDYVDEKSRTSNIIEVAMNGIFFGFLWLWLFYIYAPFRSAVLFSYSIIVRIRISMTKRTPKKIAFESIFIVVERTTKFPFYCYDSKIFYHRVRVKVCFLSQQKEWRISSNRQCAKWCDGIMRMRKWREFTKNNFQN